MSISKSFIMAQVQLGLVHECFDHEFHGTFDITVMREQKKGEIFKVPLSLILSHVLESRVYDPDRVYSLSLESLTEPGIVINMPEGDQLLIDGTHRCLARAQRNFKDMSFYFVKLEDAVRPAPGWVRYNKDWKGVNEK